MEDNIKQSKKELFECIQNLMGVIDTPVARRRINDDFSNEVRKLAREIIQSNIYYNENEINSLNDSGYSTGLNNDD
jgi:hypothetical protein